MADGEQALKTLDETQPDLITLDVVLPGMDGLRRSPSSSSGCPRSRW